MQASQELPGKLKQISDNQRAAGIPVAKNVAGIILTRPNSTSAYIGTGLELKGPLDMGVLRTSYLMLIQRHEALRTIYRLQGSGRPMLMMVQPTAEPFLRFRETAADCEAEALQIAAAAWNGKYDIETGPLARVQVIL